MNTKFKTFLPHYNKWMNFALGNTLPMKICFLLQILKVTFYEFQKKFGTSLSFKSKQNEMRLHLSILEASKYFHVVWGGPNEDMIWLHNGFPFQTKRLNLCGLMLSSASAQPTFNENEEWGVCLHGLQWTKVLMPCPTNNWPIIHD